MSRSAILLITTLTFSIMCCCGSVFGADGLQELIQGNIENVVEENISEAEEMQPEIETRVAEEVESGQAAEEAPMAEGEQGEGTDDGPAVELPDDLPFGEDNELAEGLLGAIEEQLGEEGEGLFDFGCDTVTVPLPSDATECFSVAGSTTYSTAMSEEKINQMYDDYFTGQGWEYFDQAVQGDITNAWTNESAQSYAMLVFAAGEGENGENLVSIAVIEGE